MVRMLGFVAVIRVKRGFAHIFFPSKKCAPRSADNDVQGKLYGRAARERALLPSGPRPDSGCARKVL